MKDNTSFNISRTSLESGSRAYDASMKRNRLNIHNFPVYWLNDIIAQFRKECLKTRRLYQRARKRSRETTSALRLNQGIKRCELRKAILSSKRLCWKLFCKEVGILGVDRTKPSQPELLLKIVLYLVLNEPGRLVWREYQQIEEVIPQITNIELINACSKLGNNKSPRPDQIPKTAKILQVANNRYEYPVTNVHSSDYLILEKNFLSCQNLHCLTLIARKCLTQNSESN